MDPVIGIIGGTGLENPDIFTPENTLLPHTPYGAPSSPLLSGYLKGCPTRIVMLARHGRQHTIPPHRVNFRANIRALKDAGCTHILVSAACGSLQEQYGPGALVVPDQFIDATRSRVATYYDHFEPGALKHTTMADPFDADLRTRLLEAARASGIEVHDGGTLVTIEGPRFSTRAESRMYRVLGGDLINMTVATECILANELGIPYAAMAMVTDYDSWSDTHPPLELGELLHVLDTNVDKILNVFTAAIRNFSADRA